MNKELFIKELKLMNINITEEQLNKLDKYYELLIEWNNKINLTGITNYEDVYLKHFYDSLTINKIISLTNQTLCDLGTGAGFPGLVLKIIFPNLKITLVDSLGKRCTFLECVIKELNLKDIKVINDRAEIYSKNNIEEFDIVTARAVASLRELTEYSIHLLKVNGFFIPMKANLCDELDESKNAIKLLSITLQDKKEFNLPVEGSKRTILLFKKDKPTNKLFPRIYNQIKNNPL